MESVPKKENMLEINLGQENDNHVLGTIFICKSLIDRAS
jgi:hypothetical protein